MKSLALPVGVTLTAAAVLATVMVLQQQQPTPKAELVAQLRLPDQSDDGRNVDEISGLAWNRQTSQLHAISDDGVLFEMQVSGLDSLPNGVKVPSSIKLFPSVLKSKNTEALDVANPSSGDPSVSFVTSFEDVGKIAQLTKQSSIDITISQIASLGPAIDNDGIEAVASLRDGGLAYAYERSPAQNEKDVQSLFITHGTATVKKDFAMDSKEKWKIKAIDQLSPSAFLVLLRHRVGEADNFRSKLIVVNDCHANDSKPCKVVDVGLKGGLLDGPAFEGMTMTPNGQIILAADRKRKDGPTDLFILQSSGLPSF